MSDKKNIETRIAGAGRRAEWTGGLVNPPVNRASTIVFDSYAELRNAVRRRNEQLFYGRFGTPTQWALVDAVCELEDGHGGWLFPSGMAAIATSLLAVLSEGDHLLMADSVYEPTRLLTDRLLGKFGIETSFYDPLLGAGIDDMFQDNTRAVFAESPGSLTMEIMDLPAVAETSHARGATVIFDNTWATPVNFQALAKGADIAVHAATKYIVGHSDAMLGIAVANKEVWPRLRLAAQALGQQAGPDDAYLGLRGLRTLVPRLASQQEKALEIAGWLKAHPLVDRVLHPALADCPGHEVFQRDFVGASGVFSFVLARGELADIGHLVDDMEHFSLGFSWGGFESLILPADPAPVRTAVPWSAPGPLVRLSIGLESTADLIADLEAGLDRFAKAVEC